MNKTIRKNKTIGLVTNVGLLSLLVGVNPPAWGQDASNKQNASHKEKKAWHLDYKASRADAMFEKDDKEAAEIRSSGDYKSSMREEDKATKRMRKAWHLDYKASRIDGTFKEDDDKEAAMETRSSSMSPSMREEDKATKRMRKAWHLDYKASRIDGTFKEDDDKEDINPTTSSNTTFNDVGNEATRRIDRMVVILGEMEKSLGEAARTAAITRDTPNVAFEPVPERPEIVPERRAQAFDTEESAKPVSPMMEEESEADLYEPTIPEDIIGMPRQPGNIPERLAQPPMTNLPSDPLQGDLADPMDIMEPSDMEDRPMPVVPNEVPPRILEEEGRPSQPYTSEESDLEDWDDPKQPEDNEDMMPDSNGSLDSDGNYIPPQR